MTDLLIRPVAPADLHAITSIYAHAVLHGTASWELTPPDEAEMARRADAITAAAFPYLVAERGGAVLGYAYVSAYRPRAAYRATVEDSIYVAPEVQGEGVGTALLSALITACERAGFRQMVSVIGDGEAGSIGSMRLHERLGFRLIGIARSIGYKQGRWLDQVLMQRALGEADGTPSPFATDNALSAPA